jgi:peroxiredoxin
VQLIAIGMDQPSKLRETMQHDKLDYTLLSDSDATAAKGFGIAYKVDHATLALRASSVSCMRIQILKYVLRQPKFLKLPS